MTTGMEQVYENDFTGDSDCVTQLVAMMSVFLSCCSSSHAFMAEIDAFMHCFLDFFFWGNVTYTPRNLTN